MSLAMDDLPTLSREELIDLWRARVSPNLPKKVSRRLLIATIAFVLQLEQASTSTRSTMRTIKKQVQSPDQQRKTEPLLLHKPGTRLLRQWNGRTHIVDITDNGCVWNDRHFKSLSAVAKAITGAHWSGPRFFKSCQNDPVVRETAA